MISKQTIRNLSAPSVCEVKEHRNSITEKNVCEQIHNHNQTSSSNTSAIGKVLCIVLSYNGTDDTLACLSSILEQKVDGLDILLIDNASDPGTVSSIQTAHPALEVIALSENRGWAGGNNVGIEIALKRGYKWVCLLNNDVEFPEGEVLAWLSSIKDVSPCLLHPSIYFWSEKNIAQLHPKTDGRHELYVHDKLWNEKTVMKFAYGACIAIHSEIFSKVGLFDERFFLQLEETDFYHRAKLFGYSAVCDSTVSIFHKESRAFGGRRAPIKIYYSIRNTLLLIEKNRFGIKAKIDLLKALYWSLCNLATETEKNAHVEKLRLLKWTFSASPSANAVRIGFVDYILRRFGKISARSHRKISESERLVVASAPL